MRDFRELKVWEKAHQLALTVYGATRVFPSDERYGLTAQLRRAGSSIPSTIAEGCGRDGQVELARFCRIAMGSASELEYQLLLAKDLEYLNTDAYDDLHDRVTEVKRMLTGFVQKLTADG